MSDDAEDYNHVAYCSSNSVVVISPAGRLKQVYTPFTVYAKERVNGKRGMFIVDEIRSTMDDKLVYIINGEAYFHHHFYIGVQF